MIELKFLTIKDIFILDLRRPSLHLQPRNRRNNVEMNRLFPVLKPDWDPVSRGDPQGIGIGTLLFSLYINDISTY